jgi:hypothetical protein
MTLSQDVLFRTWSVFPEHETIDRVTWLTLDVDKAKGIIAGTEQSHYAVHGETVFA